VLLVE
jgi:hypothetical protein